ncbi:hypothetical protein [Crenobacter cavernae]|uniref:Uncharacterized protein n=1 Tax=Crenobacter cavernae TaxID=2290923 RepID=A0ABY0FC60_9NEIS|nr:hypothetical protein [Crenobacter cavernae]RXZ42045.1 hypothetical protein EBB06_13425 [Crenobacter cavernae]
MGMTGQEPARQTQVPQDLGAFVRVVTEWLRRNARAAFTSAVIGAALGYAINALLLIFVYGGHQVASGVLAFGQGNALWGALGFALGGVVIGALAGYWRSVGTERFLQDLSDFPAALGLIFKRDGEAARVHLLWGAAVSLVAANLVSPWVGLFLAAGLMSSLPSILGRLVSALLLRLWSDLVRHTTPSQNRRPVGLSGMTVGVLGGALALCVGFVLPGVLPKLAFAGACAIAALILSRRIPPSAAALLAFVELAWFALGFVDSAFAQRCVPGECVPGEMPSWGGEAHHHGANVPAVLGQSVGGGGAAGLGAGLGAGVGGALGAPTVSAKGAPPPPDLQVDGDLAKAAPLATSTVVDRPDDLPPPDMPDGEPQTTWEPPETSDAGEGEPPEGAPPRRNRGATPEACLTRYDNYQAALQDAITQGNALQVLRHRYLVAVNNKQNNLAKLTIQLGADAADLASAGAAGIKGGMGVARAVAQTPEALADLITKSVQRSGNLAARLSGLLGDLADLAARSARAAAAFDEAVQLSGKAQARVAALLREAAAIETKAGNLENLLRFARNADAALVERNTMAKSVLKAEQDLRGEQQTMQRKQGLQDWANSEKASIVNEDARVFASKHEELGNARAKLEQMKARNAEAAEAARQEWQGKIDEASAAKTELESLRQKKFKRDSAQQLCDDTAAHLDDVDAQLRAVDEAELAKYRAKSEERIATAKTKLEEAENSLKDLDRQKRETKQALEDFDQALEDLPPDPAHMTPEQIAQRKALNQDYLASSRRTEAAEAAIKDWKTRHGAADDPRIHPPDELSNEWRAAYNQTHQARKELRRFDWEIKNESPGGTMSPEQMAERQRLSDAIKDASTRSDTVHQQADAAKRELWAVENQTPEQEVAAAKRQPSAERDRLQKARENAQQQSDQAKRQYADAKEVCADAGVDDQLPALQDKYNRLGNEQDARRARYEKLKSGAFPDEAEAARAQGHINELETGLANWKEPDWEQVAAQRNEPQYNAWKDEVKGRDLQAEADARLRPFEDEVKRLQGREAELEKRLNEARDQAGGRSTESIESELNAVREEIRVKKQEVESARTESEGRKAEVDQAERTKQSADADKTAKEREIEKTKEDKRQTDEALRQLEQKRDTPPKDIYEQASSTSRRLRHEFDQILENTPRPIQWPFKAMKWAGGKAGEAFRWAFGGQSPEEIAQIVKSDVRLVEERAKLLQDAQQQYDARLQRARDLKSALDACVARNR